MKFALVTATTEPRLCPVCSQEPKEVVVTGHTDGREFKVGERIAECPEGHLWRVKTYEKSA